MNSKKATFEEKEKTIMKRKIEFLEAQFSEATRRENQLQGVNEGLRRALEELTADKSTILHLINEGDTQPDLYTTLGHKNEEIRALENRIQQLASLNAQYQAELRRKEQNMDQHVRAIEEHHQRQKCHLLKKIECHEMLIRKLESEESRGQLEDLRTQNLTLRRRILEPHRNQINQTNTSHLELESMIKTLDRRDTTFNLDQIQNISFNRLPSQPSDLSSSKSRLAMTRQKPGLNDKSTTRSVISSLYCEECQESYSPNEYYKHLNRHGQKGRLMLEKMQVEQKLRLKESQNSQRRKLEVELKNISLAIKGHEKKSLSQSSRCLLR